MGCPNPPSTDELVVKLWGGRGRWGTRELALWTDEYTCEGVARARARVREEKRKEKAEWRELRGEVNFSRVRSDKDEAASTLSPWKNTRSTVSMVARTCACPIVPISRLVKVSRFLLTLSPYPRRSRFPRAGWNVGFFGRYFIVSFFIDLKRSIPPYILLFFLSSPRNSNDTSIEKNSSNCNSLQFDREIDEASPDIFVPFISSSYLCLYKSVPNFLG